ncbi:hypothetical protein [Deinococcus aluminii]|uniref:Uncharacterized protein n=1 Tax=Deinococcus aluminii TaxID=1656885 RepID=A0ABP9XH96_9DEIO
MTRVLPLPVRLRQVADALAVDGVLTVPQAVRHYAVEEDALLARFPHREVRFRPLNTSAREQSCVFLAQDAELLRWEPGWVLAHQAGTAALRHALQASRHEWERERGYGAHRPDALWHRPDGAVVAVEYDGGYPPAVVREKIRAFGEQGTYGGLVWGTASQVRTGHLRARYGGDGRQFMTVDITSTIAAAGAAPAAGGG